MSSEQKVITPAAREKLRIGELLKTFEFPQITDRWVTRYCIALHDTNPLWLDNDYAAREGRFGYRIAPGSFCVIFNPMEARGYSPASDFWAELHGKPGTYWGGHAAYNTFEYFKPLRVGDKLKAEVRNTDCFEKQGKSSVLVCAETEYLLIDQNGEKVCSCRYGNMSHF